METALQWFDMSNMSVGAVVLTKATFVLLLLWVCHALLGQANPRWRRLVWRSGVVALAVTGLLHLAAPTMGVNASVVVQAIAPIETPLGGPAASEVSNASVDLPVVVPATIASESEKEMHSVSPSPQAFDRASAIRFAYLCGLLWGVLRLASGQIHITQLLRRSLAAPGAITESFEATAREMAVARCRIRVSEEVATPTLCGVFHPTLLVPTSLLDPGQTDRWKSVFSHELSHVRSNDLRWNHAMHWLGCLLWFHPLAWRIRSAHADACELASDADAADQVGCVDTYSGVLARIAVEASTSPEFAMGMARTPDVTRRIKALKKQVHSAEVSPRRKAILFVLAVAVSVLTGVSKFAVAAPQVHSKEDVAADATAIDAQTTAALHKAFTFLASRQRADGAFGSDDRAAERLAITALCGTALLDAGNKPGEGPFGDQLQACVDFVTSHVQDDGLISEKRQGALMYIHAYSLQFLARCQIAAPDAQRGVAIENAVKLVVDSQNRQDGWRYIPTSQDADSSVTSCQLVALLLARKAGANVPDETIRRGIDYLVRCQRDDGGFNYIASFAGQAGKGQAALPRSAAAAAVLCLAEHSGHVKDQACKFVAEHASRIEPAGPHHGYAVHYLAVAMPRMDRSDFDRWYNATRKELLQRQGADGQWSDAALGTDYGTAIACIALLSPQHLPSK